MESLKNSSTLAKNAALIAGPLLGLLAGAGLVATGSTAEIGWTVGVTVLVALWWIFEPLPIAVTSLIPVAVFPLVGVLDSSEVGQAYGDKLILLMLGGFMLSKAMERSGAHRRIALLMVRLFGGSGGPRLIYGFMAASAFLSMWISNAATTLMLLPIALAVVERAEDSRLATGLLLGIAYAASIGGIATPIGTPPNLVFMQVYEANTGMEPSFLQWMGWALPITFVMIPIAGWWLTRGMPKDHEITLPTVGAWRAEEVRTLLVLAATALLWITRKEPGGGWSTWLGLPSANDASIALLAVVALFIVPNGRGERLMTWESAVKIPWGLLLLFAGGISIARAFIASGLSQSLGEALSQLGSLPLLALTLSLCLAVTFLTEITSNTATTTLLMPILAAAAIAAGIDPKQIMIPAALSASFAFM
ncbi:MAG: DASS family sodium-coupled anion symporter, partial [Planctomycetota bacterium]